MQVPLSWLKEYVDLTLSTDDLVERLTLAGLEVGSVQTVGDWWDPETIGVGQVVAVKPHPDADRLVLVDVDYGAEAPQTVVTGAPNLYQFKGQSLDAGTLPVLKVAFARNGAVLVDAYSEETPRPKKKLKPAKIRGVRSEGMVCSERELGLSEEHDGIILLPEDAPVGAPLRDYLGDTVVEIDLTPDMARCLSMAGVAREVSALTNVSLHLPADEWQPSGEDNAAEYVEVAIDSPEYCPRYTAIVIRDVQVGPSPAWLQDRLRKAGQRPISNIVDITNYVMLELGQPLHAFDYDLLLARAKESGREIPRITVRTATPGEQMETIDHVKRTLDDSILLITDSGGPIAIAGVMGGAETEVHDGTVNVLLESATFEGINNRRTSQKLKLHSEASHRFTRGVPAKLNDIAARRAADLMRAYAGGRIVPGIVDAYPIPQPEVTVYTTESEVRRQLGMDVNLPQIAQSLQRLDFQVTELADLPADPAPTSVFGLKRVNGEPVLAARAPWHRLDIAIPADLTEEVARIIGYDKVGVTLLDTMLPPQRRNFVLETEEQIRDILIGCGLFDTINYTLTSIENHDKMHAFGVEEQARHPFVELENPPSMERRVMRRSLLVSAMENLAYNSRYAQRLAFFEIGRVYRPEENDGLLPKEDRRVAIGLSGPRRATNIHQDTDGRDNFDFFDAKGIVETLVQRMGFRSSDLRFVPQPDTPTFGPRCAQIFLKEQSLGIVGEVHPRVRANFNLPDQRVCLVEMHIEPLIRRGWQVEPMQPISSYPPVVEDLAFVVAEEVTVRRVQDAIKQHGGDLLVDIELFDIYRGPAVSEGHKSLAFRVTYQSLSHVLSEKEVTHWRGRIISGVETDLAAKLRA